MLKITHTDGGFFSCSTIALQDIVRYINEHGDWPEEIDRSVQYGLLKPKKEDNLIPLFFLDDHKTVVKAPIDLNLDCMAIQFANYDTLPFEALEPIIEAYFMPSLYICGKYNYLLEKYKIDTDNLISVVYRGNDKSREMKIANYGMFIDKTYECLDRNPNAQILVLPDECGFKKEMQKEFDNVIIFDETPCTDVKNSAVFYQIPQDRRASHAGWFFASLLIASEAQEVVTHSGNIGLWTALYRGHTEGLHQVFNDKWY